MARNKAMGSVRIGPMTFDVINVRGLCNEEKAPIFGIIEYAPATIQIDAGLCAQTAYITLWHEVLHGILVCAGVDEHDEQTLLALAHGVVQVLESNPDLRSMKRARKSQLVR